MVQMTPADQAVVRALPGNGACCDCGMKSPQWASVSFGNVFCLECSGVHRSLGVHISFVRSIAMDSWTDKQLALMKTGGNDKCNDYLQSKGIGPRTSIKQKYESDAAQLYKEVLKARVEGRPEPTSLAPAKKKTSSAPSSMGSMGGGSKDANGMERLAGETEQQYVARQTRLRDEARARMQAKFGSGGMGGVSSSGSGMQGIGSNPNYNPNSGGYGGGAGLDDVVNGVSSAFSTGLSLVGGAASTVTAFVKDDQAKASISNIGSSASSYAGGFWGSLSSAAKDVASTITQPDGDGGLEALQREFASHKPAQSKYSGFGSTTGSGSNWSSQATAGSSMGGVGGLASAGGGGATLEEAPGLPGEDRNGVERLTGETDDQYVTRQTRLRDEAKARMAAKFGGGGMSAASSSSAPSSGNFGAPAPSSGGYGGAGMQLKQSGVSPAPRSGGIQRTSSKDSKESLNSDDFFSSFGT